MPQINSTSWRKTVAGQFGIIFLPIALILIGIVLAIIYQEYHDDLALLKNEELRLAKLHDGVTEYELKMIISDLMTLSAHAQFRSFLDKPSAHDQQSLSSEFLAFSSYNGTYDQIRYLDNTGMEIIRIDFHNGKPAVVPDAQLQHKGDRYYFTDTIKLNKGDIFVSPFDLNIEHKMIERPFKPMLRVAMPLFDGAGNKSGILILNYLGQHLFDRIDSVVKATDSKASIMLLNQQGYWLKGLKSEDEWGFMFKDEKRTFGRAFPDAWAKIAGEKSGQFSDAAGLFSFQTIYPLSENLRSSTGSAKASGASAAQIGSDEYFWKLVVYIPSSLITANTRKLLNTLLPLLFATITVLGIGSFYIARANVSAVREEENIEHLAHYDILTGLPNRALLYDRLKQLIAREERHKRSFALLFIDLDGFKSVNDKYGHEAGDVVLKEAASRIRSLIRKPDTAARIGGDEFMIALTDVKNHADVRRVSEEIIASLGKPFPLKGELQATIGASVGIGIYPADGQDMDILIKHADEAMYQAKNAGKNGYRFYSPETA